MGKAHRLIKIKKEEWGFLACQIDPGKVWVNTVGTFGITSAAFWWARLAGISVRIVYGLMGHESPLDVLLYADDLEWIAEEKEERISVLLSVCLFLAIGAPLKWSKFRGGYEVSWIGLGISYKEYALGLTEARASWMIGWLMKVVDAGKVHFREFLGGLGRLNFTATALYYEKPFLGPLFTWASAIQRFPNKLGIFLVPWAVRLILLWLAEVFKKAGRLSAAPRNGGTVLEWFRSDAKAEGGRAWIGGWEVLNGCDPAKARWFSTEVKPEDAEWINWKGDPQRVIASLELLGTIVSIMLFGDSGDKEVYRAGVLSGSTDNQGNTFATSKMMSTKFPLTILLMELSEQMRRRRTTLHLSWLQRDSNSEADALTNEDFTAFSPQNRMNCSLAELDWIVLPKMMASSETLYKDIITQKGLLGKEARLVKVRKTSAAKRLRWTDPW